MLSTPTIPGLKDFYAWQVAMTVIHCISIGIILFRIYSRWSTKKLWLDDYSTVVPLLIESFHLSTLWVLNPKFFPPENPQTKVIFYWIANVTFILLLWSSRLSLALSVTRIFPRGDAARSTGFAIAVIVVLFGLATLFTRVGLCLSNREWETSLTNPLCPHTDVIIVLSVSLDVVSDVMLAALPLYSLRRMSFAHRSQRNLLMGSFSASLLTIGAAILYVSVAFGHIPTELKGSELTLLLMMPHLEAAISTIACNFALAVAALYRVSQAFERKPERNPAPNADCLTEPKFVVAATQSMAVVSMASIQPFPYFQQTQSRNSTSTSASTSKSMEAGRFSHYEPMISRSQIAPRNSEGR